MREVRGVYIFHHNFTSDYPFSTFLSPIDSWDSKLFVALIDFSKKSLFAGENEQSRHPTKSHELEKRQAEFNGQLQQASELHEQTKKENSAMKIEIDTLRLKVAQINSSSLNKARLGPYSC